MLINEKMIILWFYFYKIFMFGRKSSFVPCSISSYSAKSERKYPENKPVDSN